MYNLISELKVDDKFFRVHLGILLCYFSETSLLWFIMLYSCEVSFQMLRPEINKQKDLVEEIVPEWPKWVMLCLGWCFHDKLIVFNTIKDWVVSLKWITFVFYIAVKKKKNQDVENTKFDSKVICEMTYLTFCGNGLFIILFLRIFKKYI